MILKEAFRTYNFYSELIEASRKFLLSNDALTITQEHNCKKSNPDAKNEIITIAKTKELVPNDVINFVMDVFAEQEKLAAAIAKAKATAAINMDAELGLNKTRQMLQTTFSNLAKKKSEERTSTGYGYKFNINGDQIKYAYEINEVTTIDYDRNKVKALARTLLEKSDAVSAQVDLDNVTIKVDYIPKYFIGDSFEDSLEIFLAQ